MNSWISIAVSLLAIYLASNEGRWQLARRKGVNLIYAVGWFVRSIYLVGVFAYPVLAAMPSNDRFTAAGLLIIPITLVVTWPKTIVLNEQGVTELRWGGLLKRSVVWSNVMHGVRIQTSQESEVQLILGRGSPIVHSKYHVDRSGFVREISKHTQVF